MNTVEYAKKNGITHQHAIRDLQKANRLGKAITYISPFSAQATKAYEVIEDDK